MAIPEAVGYACTKSAASLGMWDIVAIGSADVVLVQVKSNSWPTGCEMEASRDFRCPQNAKKLIHRWRDRQRLPDVRELY